jgi:hypothetical protein
MASSTCSTSSPAAADREQLMLQLLQIAGGDPDTMQSLKALLWQSYSEADFPFGMTEEGMCMWWSYNQQTTLH